MTYLKNHFPGKKIRVGFRDQGSNDGITLVELMVAMAVAGIVLLAIYSAYHTQSTMYKTQSVELAMQQNLRGAAYIFESEVRMAGYDQTSTGAFGITDIRFRNIAGNPDLNGHSSITFTSDLDDDGALDTNETFFYSIADIPLTTPDGILDMTRDNGAFRQIIGESIIAFGLAFAYDNDGDGRLDLSANGNVIWAIDSDNDNDLDRNLDTNDDGEIDISDNPAGTAIGGSDVVIGNIRAVKSWILARTKTPLTQYQDNNAYVVGNRRISPTALGTRKYKHQLLVSTINCRNLGMQ